MYLSVALEMTATRIIIIYMINKNKELSLWGSFPNSLPRVDWATHCPIINVELRKDLMLGNVLPDLHNHVDGEYFLNNFLSLIRRKISGFSKEVNLLT